MSEVAMAAAMSECGGRDGSRPVASDGRLRCDGDDDDDDDLDPEDDDGDWWQSEGQSFCTVAVTLVKPPVLTPKTAIESKSGYVE